MLTRTSVTGCGGNPGVPSESQGLPSFITNTPVTSARMRRPGPIVSAFTPLPVARTPSMKMPGAPPWPVWSELTQFPSASTITLWLLPRVIEAATFVPPVSLSIIAVRSTPGCGIVCRTNWALSRAYSFEFQSSYGFR